MLMRVTRRVKKKQDNHLEILGGAVPGISKFLMGYSPVKPRPSAATAFPPSPLSKGPVQQLFCGRALAIVKVLT